nr:PREDICTED: uncharacterized protein LOC109635385 [Paralichthys olivaceus]
MYLTGRIPMHMLSVKVTLNLAAVLGVAFACLAGVLCLVLIIYLIYKKCRKRRNQTVATTTYVANVPGQPHPPYQYYPGYQPVPALHGYGGLPVPTAPPHSYMEATHPAHFPVPSPLGHPMNPLYSPGESYPPPPPYSDDMAHPPYNPSYGPMGAEPKS